MSVSFYSRLAPQADFRWQIKNILQM